MSLCQFTSLPSLAHSLAQTSATFSGTGLEGLRTTSTLTPIASSTHFLPLPWQPASTHKSKTRKATLHLLSQQQPYAVLVGHLGAVDPCF